MKEFKAKIIDPEGLHARPASIVVKKAAQFDSKITIFANNQERNMKSIMHIMALGAAQGANIKIVCEGKDEKEACATIENALKENKLT